MSKELQRIKEILASVKPLAAEYYRLTGKPLGVTGEVAEYIVAQELKLTLVPPRTSGHDAIRKTPKDEERIQIKGRALDSASKKSQRIGSIKADAACDKVIVVLLENRTLEPVGMWEANYEDVITHLEKPGSRARNDRGSMSVSASKKIAQPIWP
jgi:hypothetical protein